MIEYYSKIGQSCVLEVFSFGVSIACEEQGKVPISHILRHVPSIMLLFWTPGSIVNTIKRNNRDIFSISFSASLKAPAELSSFFAPCLEGL